jgi:MFS family permease
MLSKLRRQFVVLGFAKGFLLWYAIEKLFQTKIGITPEQIIAIGVVAQGSKILFEIPTSVFADRWDRRKTLIIAQLAMIGSCLVLGVSNSIPIYIIGILFWSLSDALNSGVYEAFAYDTVAHAGYKSKFKSIYTRMNSSELLSIGLAGIVAGVLATHFNLRLSFFLSAISGVVCLFLFLRLQEPPRERTGDIGIGWVSHLGGAFKIIASARIRWTAVLYITLIGFLAAWYEYYQLLGIEAKLSPVLFGSLITVLTFGMLVGSELAHHVAATRKALSVVWVVLIAAHLIGLRFASASGIFVSLFVTFIVFMMLELYLELYLQDNIGSERRATVFSLLTSLSYAWFFVLAAIFGLTISHIGIRGALTVASLPLLLLGVIDIARRIPWATNKVSDVLPDEEIIHR